jgi:hypothetical protein
MFSIISFFQSEVAKLAAYNRTVAALSALPLESQWDLDIYSGDVRSIARNAVYGA